MNILEQIMAERRADSEQARFRLPVSELIRRAEKRQHRSLTARLQAGQGTSIIAEVKKASPSAGLLKPDYRPAETAASVEAVGAVGISVLTEPRHFLGRDEHLSQVRAAVSLPVLRKDFIGNAYQIYESAALGADVILLIVAALNDRELTSLHAEALKLGLEVLVESHTREELHRALALTGSMVGVNSRNLKTLKTDLQTARDLVMEIPRDRFAIAESGIKTREEVLGLQAAGYRGFLIGETLARGADAAAALRALMG
jgi:indole-3-glycerol phosphate synthase